VKRLKKIRVLIADDIEETRNLISKLLSIKSDTFDVVGMAQNGQEVLNLISKVHPDILLMDINMPIMNGLETQEVVESKYPQVITIIMSVQSDNEYLKKAMFLGAKDYIIKPFTYEQIIESIENTYNKYHAKQEMLISNNEFNATVTSFFSTKGGVGKSLLASNFASLQAQFKNKRTILLDLDLQFGDQALLFDKQNSKNIVDIIEENSFKNMDDILPFINEIDKNLHLITAPKNPEKAEYIHKESVIELLELLIKNYEFIVIDLGVNYDDITLSILDKSNRIYFVTTPDLLALKNTKLGLEVMSSLNYDKDKVKIIVNSYSNSYSVKMAEIENLLKFEVISIIPFEEKTIRNSVNVGIPILSNNKNKSHILYKGLKDL
jgi:pilus assembly protein CpaE